MAVNDIPENVFLLTELRYTLGQLHVQLGDLEPHQRQLERGGRSVNRVLQEMMDRERRFQQEYARATHIPAPGAQETPRGEEPDDETFEKMRLDTITLLEQVEPWPDSLLDAIKQQVAGDRAAATELAELRQYIFEHPDNQHLMEPLTQGGTPTPGQNAE